MKQRKKETRGGEKSKRETYEPSMILEVLYVKKNLAIGSQQIYKCTVPSFYKVLTLALLFNSGCDLETFRATDH